MIGVYLPPEVDREMEDRNLRWTVTGRVDTCERIWTRPAVGAPLASPSTRPDPNYIYYVTVPGYCHHRDRGVVLNAHVATPHLN